jgi:hypothetical protein
VNHTRLIQSSNVQDVETTMRARVLVLATVAALGAAPAFAAPFENFFDYEEPRLPRAGDCSAIAAELGPGATWYGEYSGKRYDTFNDEYYPFAARGCFKSETACRIWQQRAITYSIGGPIYYTSCRPGGPS